MDGAIAWMPLSPELPVVGTVTQTLARGTPAHCMQDKGSLAAEVSLLDVPNDVGRGDRVRVN
jgi:hypothetical protein